MTREEALQILDTIPTISEQVDALEMAIQALSQEPCRYWQNGKCNGNTEVCDDAISREDIDRILMDMGMYCAYDMPSFWANKGKDYKVIPTKWHKGYQQAVADFDKRIRDLPSVTQKSGKWDGSCTCSVCGQWRILESEKNGGKYKYCPNCGARMESEVRNDNNKNV